MKAYVIKNKEGEYLQFFDADSDDISFTDDLTLAMLYDKNEKDIMKKAYSNMEWKYPEITMAEGDLEKEIADKDKEIDTLRKTILRLSNEKERIHDGLYIDYLSFAKQIRHQICKEIREWCQNDWDYDDFMYFLDKIEKGE